MLDVGTAGPTSPYTACSFLLYGLLDVVVDGYFDAVQLFDDYYDEVSEGIFAERPLPRQAAALVPDARPRALPPPGCPVARSGQQPHAPRHPAGREECTPISRTCTTTFCGSASGPKLRDLVATIVETHLSLRDYRQNQIMKKVTELGRDHRHAPLVTGFYGMNVPYPGSARPGVLWFPPS